MCEYEQDLMNIHEFNYMYEIWSDDHGITCFLNQQSLLICYCFFSFIYKISQKNSSRINYYVLYV